MVIDIEQIPIGSMVQTPTGRLGVVAERVFGSRESTPRCRIRYLDTSTRESTLIQPNLLIVLCRGDVFRVAIKKWLEDEEQKTVKH